MLFNLKSKIRTAYIESYLYSVKVEKKLNKQIEERVKKIKQEKKDTIMGKTLKLDEKLYTNFSEAFRKDLAEDLDKMLKYYPPKKESEYLEVIQIEEKVNKYLNRSKRSNDSEHIMDTFLFNKLIFYYHLTEGYLNRVKNTSNLMQEIIKANSEVFPYFSPLAISTRMDNILMDLIFNENIDNLDYTLNKLFEEIANGVIVKDRGLYLKGLLYFYRIHFETSMFEVTLPMMRILSRLRVKSKGVDPRVRDLFTCYMLFKTLDLKNKLRKNVIEASVFPNRARQIPAWNIVPACSNERGYYGQFEKNEEILNTLKTNNLEQFTPIVLYRKAWLVDALGRHAVSSYYYDQAIKTVNKFSDGKSPLVFDFQCEVLGELYQQNAAEQFELALKNLSTFKRFDKPHFRQVTFLFYNTLFAVNVKSKEEILKLVETYVKIHKAYFRGKNSFFLNCLKNIVLVSKKLDKKQIKKIFGDRFND